MKTYINRQIQRLLACLLVVFISMAQLYYAPVVQAGNENKASFLNDRAANIIGATSLQASGLVVPEGLSGKGIIVGLADSGLDKGSLAQLPADLQSSSGRIPRVVMLKSFAGRDVPDDPVGHGTHMAGTIVGNGEASGGQFKGLAPGASIYFQALLDKEGRLKIPANLDDLFYPAYSAGVRIHVNGWGEESNSYNSHTAQVDNFVYQHPDFLPIFGAGNEGPGQGTLSSEANSKNALVVGSSQTARPVFSPEAIDAGQVAGSSSAGPTADGRMKPDLLAPGSANISLCSSLTTSNYQANPAYTRMGGTSMAASVTGGAAAILVEYLKNQKKVVRPSSALLKALLINGARPINKGPKNTSGYGILDLAGTILPLMQGSFVIADNQIDIKQDDCLEYHFLVSDTSRPFKATLAWIDSPSPSGSPGLVDDLNIEVIDPRGQNFSCNDQQDNVEQIAIDKPLAGRYTIRVRGASLQSPLWSTHYALVYGQVLQHDVVSNVNLQENKLYLASGAYLNLDQYSIKGSIDGREVYSTSSFITPGSDVYICGNNLYLFGESWESGGIQVIEQEHKTLLVEMNPEVRQGGYFLDLNSKISLMLNGKPLDRAADVPLGVKILASINPRLQTVWSLNASYSMATGYIEKIDWANHKIKLLRDDTWYELAPWCAMSSQDTLLNSSDADLPYGSINSTGQDTLAPGIKVSMTVSPYDKKVQYLKTERQVVVAEISKVNDKTGEICTQDGKTYKIFPGSKVVRDGKQASLKDCKAGDKISGVMIKDINQFVELQAYSNVIYGRVVYYSPEASTVYLFDSNNRYWLLPAPDISHVISGGMRAGTSLSPGNWIRVALDRESMSMLRVDLAQEKQVDVSKVFRYYDANQQLMYMTDGSNYRYTQATQMIKLGYKFTPDLLCSGEQVVITTLNCPGSSKELLARADVKINNAVEPPKLEATSGTINSVLVIRGNTTANRIEIIRQDGSREFVPVSNDGSFSCILPQRAAESMVTILAIDSRNGGLTRKNLEVTFAHIPQFESELKVAGAPGYSGVSGKVVKSAPEDDKYDQNMTVSRAVFINRLGEAADWQVGKPEPIKNFADNESIPDEVRGNVYFARKNGFVSGYPDGTFRPGEDLTRSAMVSILTRVVYGEFPQEKKSHLPYLDSTDLPSWAGSSYQFFFQQRWLNLFGSCGLIKPNQAVTHGEAEMFIDRVTKHVQQSLKKH